ncbi:DoxX family protein [Promicromonospora aerolata]|uniref:DoxX family protein n=1 Tax=Promicromonospora aerolata TaxID=195749 RepID=A0ABW4VD10_9MICO
MNFPWTKDLAVLVARVAIGAVLIAHGAQKFFTFGIGGTVDSFAGMGVPVPEAAALFAAVVELVGGAALVLGAATSVAGLLVTLNMLGALVLVHLGNGVFVDQGGFELVAALGAGALILAATGPGAWSVDHLVGRTRTARRAVATAAG